MIISSNFVIMASLVFRSSRHLLGEPPSEEQARIPCVSWSQERRSSTHGLWPSCTVSNLNSHVIIIYMIYILKKEHLARSLEVPLKPFLSHFRLRSPDGEPFHYFRMSGKDYYRAPECYVPPSKTCPGLVVQARCFSQFTFIERRNAQRGWAPGREVQVTGGGYLTLYSTLKAHLKKT